MALSFISVGVYESTEESFFESLQRNGIDTFCDIRNRRGVRGVTYSYANSNRLQAKLRSLGIKYIYIPELAPSDKIRLVQRRVDQKDGVRNNQRKGLSSAFKEEFQKGVLSKFNFINFFEELEDQGAQKVALFCVESNHEACHRSLVMKKIHTDFRYPVSHIEF